MVDSLVGCLVVRLAVGLMWLVVVDEVFVFVFVFFLYLCCCFLFLLFSLFEYYSPNSFS